MSKPNASNFSADRVSVFTRIKRGVVTLLVGGMLLGAPGYAFYDYHFNTETYNVQVTDKYERQSGTNANGQPMQVKRVDVAIPGDPDGETFEVSDTWLPVNRASGDTYRALQRGGEYQVTVKGWRIPLLSMFKTVTDVRNPDGSPLNGSNGGFKLQHGNGAACSPFMPPEGYVLVPVEAIKGLEKSDVVDPATINAPAANGMAPR